MMEMHCYKLTLAIEYPSLKPLAFILHCGSPHDAPLFEEILRELKRRRIARTGDLVICDKGYYSYQNYVDGILNFRIVPPIFSKKKFSLKNLLNRLSYPLSVFGRSDTRDRVWLFKRLVKNLITGLAHQNTFMAVRSLIGCFQIGQKCVLLKEIPPLYNPLSEKGRLSECTFTRNRCISGFSLKEAITEPR